MLLKKVKKLMNKKESKLLVRVKNTLVQLRVNYQVPISLVVLTNRLDQESDIRKVMFLNDLCEHYMRVKGYYKKFPLIEKESNEQIYKLYKEKFG